MVLVYVKDKCAQCDATTRTLERLGIPYQTRDAVTDTSWKKWLPEAMSAPIVVVENTGVAWSGFRHDKINALSV